MSYYLQKAARMPVSVGRSKCGTSTDRVHGKQRYEVSSSVKSHFNRRITPRSSPTRGYQAVKGFYAERVNVAT